MRRVALLVFLSLGIIFGQANPKILDFNQHAWASYSGDHRVAGRWGVHFDAQWRRADLGTRWQQYQLRPAVNFEVSRNLLLTTGYAYTRAYPYGDYPVAAAFPEHRIYQQAVVRHPREGLRFSQRYRLEQRFIQYPNTPDRSWTYQNRFRYMFRAEAPLTKNGSAAPAWYIPIWDEILFGIPPNYGARTFDQNRLFVGVGRSAGALGNIEVGFMNQFLGQRNGQIFEFNNTLFVTFTSNFDLSGLWR
jgi:hypothetical protein